MKVHALLNEHSFNKAIMKRYSFSAARQHLLATAARMGSDFCGVKMSVTPKSLRETKIFGKATKFTERSGFLKRFFHGAKS